ncbi:MAG TPA: CerR family C-terminal domain-containing protein [Pirellulales bacterium]|nr:CerR family C-terminal domain-containing protein [Pirellulales bacterium]
MSSDVDDTKLRLLETAGTVFAEKGYRAATVREICQRASVNLAAVNYHFGDKERLYIESVKRAHFCRGQHVPPPSWPDGTAPEDKLRDVIRAILERMLAAPDTAWHGQLMMRELQQPTAACAELVRDYMRPHFDLIRSILVELLPDSIGDDKLRLIAFGIVGQCLHFRLGRAIIGMLTPPEEFRRYQAGYLAEHVASWTLAAVDGLRLRAEQGVDR